MRSKLLSILCLAMLSRVAGYGQGGELDDASSSIKSNTSIGTYNPIGANYNLYDGTANISIPIFGYSHENTDFGISLTYNTKGVLVDEESSSVGLHWRINAGGSITRELKDIPDEMNMYCGYNDNYGEDQPFFYIKGKWGQEFGASDPNEDFPANTIFDREHDDFHVNAPGLSFTFNIGQNGQVFTIPEKHVKVELFLNDQPVTSMPLETHPILTNLFYFKITDEGGNRYFFSVDDNTDSWTLYQFRDGSVTAPPNTFAPYAQRGYHLSWRLSKVILNNGDVINYHFDQDNTGTELRRRVQNPASNGTIAVSADESSADNGTLAFLNNSFGVGQTKYDRGPSWIEYPDHTTVKFLGINIGIDYAWGTENRINAIEVGNEYHAIRYLMDQYYRVSSMPGYNNGNAATIAINSSGSPMELEDYFPGVNDNNVGNGLKRKDYLRMMLRGIRILADGAAQDLPYYTFEYNALALPHKKCGSKDFFGYYNGIVHGENNGLTSGPAQYNFKDIDIPFHTHRFESNRSYGVDKSHNATYAQAGLLKKITNGQGGSVAYEYEAHELSNVLATYLVNAGGTGYPQNDSLFFGQEANDGIRIKKITETDRIYPDAARITSITYSGGQRFIPGAYYHYPYVIDEGDVYKYMFSGYPVTARPMVNGSNHGYSSVTSEVKNQSGNLLGKTVTTFTNFQDATSNNKPRYFMAGEQRHFYKLPYADRQYIKDWEMGLPLAVTDYDQNNKIVSSISNTYNFILDENSAVNVVENKKVFFAYKNQIGLLEAREYLDSVAYHPYRGQARLVSTVSKKYVSDADYIEDEVEYGYDSRNNLSYTIATDSRGDKFKQVNIYNYDIDVQPGSTTDPTPASLIDMNLAGLEKIVGIERWKLGDNLLNPNQMKLMDASITLYDYDNQKLLAKGLYALQRGASIQHSVYNPISQDPYQRIIDAYTDAGVSIPDFKQASLVTRFDQRGNPAETRLMEQEQYKAMCWNKMTKEKEVEAANAKLGEIGYAGFEPDYDGVMYTENMSNTRYGFTYYPSLCVSTGSVPAIMAGTKAYKINPTLQGNLGNANPLYFDVSATSNGLQYIAAFWNYGALPVLSGNNGTGSITFNLLYTAPNGWKYYEGTFTPANGERMSFSAPNGAAYLDDVRIHPKGAFMQTWTHNPISGVTETSDARGRITKYEYDSYGRPVTVRDQDGNILSKQSYQNQ